MTHTVWITPHESCDMNRHTQVNTFSWNTFSTPRYESSLIIFLKPKKDFVNLSFRKRPILVWSVFTIVQTYFGLFRVLFEVSRKFRPDNTKKIQSLDSNLFDLEQLQNKKKRSRKVKNDHRDKTSRAKRTTEIILIHQIFPTDLKSINFIFQRNR